MRKLIILTLCAIALAGCSRDGQTDRHSLSWHRQKIAGALETGFDSIPFDELKSLLDSEEESLDLTVEMGPGAAFRGTIAMHRLREDLAGLTSITDSGEYERLLATATSDMDVHLYYDGDFSRPRAAVSLKPMRYRDSFGVFFAYEPVFRFEEGYVISIEDFFNSMEFYRFKDKLLDFLDSI